MRPLLVTISVLASLALVACSGADGETRFTINLTNLNAQSAANVSSVATPDSPGAVCPGRSTC